MGALFGLFGKAPNGLLPKMADLLRHRGAELVTRDAGSFQVGLRGSPDSQCLLDGHQAIAFTGSFHEATTAEDLLETYRRFGVESVARTPGAFVLAIRDGERLFLCRDAVGHRTLFYTAHRGTVRFASEIKALLSDPDVPREIRPGALAQYLTYSFIPGEGTMLQNVYELPPGTWVEFSAGRRVRGPVRYVRFEHHERSEELSEREWTEQFRTLFSRAVARRLSRAERPVVFLSGGIDSSIVTAELARQSTRPVRSYAIHFGENYGHELDFARAVADRCGTDHHEVCIQPKQFLPNLRRMLWHLDDPIGDPVAMPNFELARLVSAESSSVFNGEGGDPCFGGPKNLPMLLHHWYGQSFSPRFREEQYLRSYRRAYEEIEHLLTPEWRAQFDSESDLAGPLRPYFDPPGDYFLDKLRTTNMRLKGAHLILPKVERMLGAWGMRPLSPLFDQELVAFSYRMPPSLILKHGIEKRVLKLAFRDELPAAVIDRPKSGMRVPVHFWFQGELRRYARKILSPRAIRKAGIFQPDRVRQILNYATEEGPGRYGIRLWMLVTFELWRRVVVEREPV